MTHRVVITGVGCLTPLGNNFAEVQNSLMAGIPGISISSELNWPVGSVNFDIDSYFDRFDIQVTDRFARGGYLTYCQAKHDSGTIPEGIYLGVSNGAGHETNRAYRELFDKDRVRPNTLITLMLNSAVNFITKKEQINGPAFTFSAACASSSIAIGEAYRAIRNGDYNILAAGGSDFSLTTMSLRCWQSMMAAAKESKPFSQSRKGIILSEGSVILFLENLQSALARKAKIYGEIVGYGISCGAETITKPNEKGQKDAIEKAITNINVDDITYINAHGTGTPIGDIVELQSIAAVFKEKTPQIPISSTKNLHGHLLGSSGCMEMLSCLTVLKNDKVIPNWHLNDPDKDIPNEIFLPTSIVDKTQKVCLNNTFAFGGTNIVIAMEKYHGS